MLVQIQVLKSVRTLKEPLFVKMIPLYKDFTHPGVALYMYCQYIKYKSYYQLTYSEESSVIEAATRYASYPMLLREVAKIILTKGDVETVLDSLDKIGIPPLDLPQSGYRYLVRVVSLGRKDLFYKFKMILDDGELSKPIRLKIYFLLARIESSKELVTYKQLENQMLAIQDNMSKEYGRLKQYLDRVPAENFFLDIATSQAKMRRFRELVRQKLYEKKPFSYFRVNDGECYGFPEENLISSSAIERQEMHWWGSCLQIDDRVKVQRQFAGALKRVDAVGVPGLYKFINDMKSTEDYDLFSSAHMCRSFGAAFAVMRQLSGRELVLDAQSNLSLFDLDFLNILISEAENILIVTGFNDVVLGRIFNNDSIEYISLPTHNLLKHNKYASKTAGRLPDVYESICLQIKNKCAPGTLCLFSAGFLGKIMIDVAASNGAVALDMGQYLLRLVEEEMSIDERNPQAG